MYSPQKDYFRVTTARPEVCLADIDQNTQNITNLYKEAVQKSSALVVFPELSITGYSIGDLVQNNSILSKAKDSLSLLASETSDTNSALIVGLPFVFNNKLFNCAAVLAEGQIKGIVPKSHLPNYNEFYEERWFTKYKNNKNRETIRINEHDVPFGTDLLFDIGGTKVGIEICEDLWVADPPSRKLSEMGALVIANLSASPELTGKNDYRRKLVEQTSGRLIVGYVYSGADQSESTMDTVLGGHQIIAVNGSIVAENEPFDKKRTLQYDIDTAHLIHDRIKNNNWQARDEQRVIQTVLGRSSIDPSPKIIKNPFLPTSESQQERDRRLSDIISIQATGLAQRIKTGNHKGVVLGLSGGLDSTLALLVASEASKILNKQPKDIIETLTMPGLASSSRTQDNAQLLANGLNVKNTVIPISKLSENQLLSIGHGLNNQDTTYENTQARVRTSLLFNYANDKGLIVLGTGDLSEIALGWCTFGADHLSHYNVNATIPKTLVRSLVNYLSQQPNYQGVKHILDDIIDTPVSPELVSDGKHGISQKTEDIIGPYELHDFFLYQFHRWGDDPNKIAFLAKKAFKDDYKPQQIEKWLAIFMERFTKNQFKRSVMPDGPKVGSVSLSPRGDWRMPSDIPSA